MNDFSYLSGFGNYLASEAKPGALPQGCNNPQKPAWGLYAEQLSGTAFTALPGENKRSWLYRAAPSVLHTSFVKTEFPRFLSSTSQEQLHVTPQQLRWDPPNNPDGKKDFVDGTFTYCVSGDLMARQGAAIHVYQANTSMENRVFLNSDGEMLLVPQQGAVVLQTEFGYLDVQVGEIAVVPRGIKFKVLLKDETWVRGYICENYGPLFRLPYRGPIGANGLANERDFLVPTACYEKDFLTSKYELIMKLGGAFFSCTLNSSPFDVVAWHGNYWPYKYDLRKFNTMGSISYDHPDPSIFTVLTSPSLQAGVASIDFVIFPPRWMVAENTFRPPYYHRNIMSEFMGLIYGIYDAKPGSGFQPGGASLHNSMSAHGPDAEAFMLATQATLKPEKQENTMAFMFESCWLYRVAHQALTAEFLQDNYLGCWENLKVHFKG